MDMPYTHNVFQKIKFLADAALLAAVVRKSTALQARGYLYYR